VALREILLLLLWWSSIGFCTVGIKERSAKWIILGVIVFALPIIYLAYETFIPTPMANLSWHI